MVSKLFPGRRQSMAGNYATADMQAGRDFCAPVQSASAGDRYADAEKARKLEEAKPRDNGESS